VTLDDFRHHLGGLPEIAEDSAEEAALLRLLEAAQGLVEAELGYAIAERYEDAAPPALAVAVLQLAAHWYAVRPAATELTLATVPFACRTILDAFRDRSF
jgi:hypothetical protein